jgi:hypothetical protein
MVVSSRAPPTVDRMHVPGFGWQLGSMFTATWPASDDVALDPDT